MHVQTATALIKLGFHYGRVPVAGRDVDVTDVDVDVEAEKFSKWNQVSSAPI